MLKTPCVILCGGKSSRMREDIGVDKAYLDFWGKPLYQRQFEKLSLMFDSTYLSAKTSLNYPNIKAQNIIEDIKELDGLDVNTLFAPALGMLSAFKMLKCEEIFFVSVDSPFIKEESIETLLQNPAINRAAAHKDKIHPTIGVYNKSITLELEMMIKENKHKLTLLLEKIGTIFVNLEDGDELANLNRYEDYEKAIRDGINPFG